MPAGRVHSVSKPYNWSAATPKKKTYHSNPYAFGDVIVGGDQIAPSPAPARRNEEQCLAIAKG